MQKETYKATMKEFKQTLKEGKKFMKERKAMMKRYKKLLNPFIDYDEEYDILYLGWGQRKCESTIEISDSVRFDVDKNGTIIAVEIENFKEKIRRGKI